MRDEFMRRIDARNDKTSYDVAAYPFGAEEMLLNLELKGIEKIKKIDVEKSKLDIVGHPFGLEEVLLNAELKDLDIR